ncbi:MAG: hypothetical protein K6E86_04740 [Bacteroidales bacterium]|nr:hypothetical protein [Bacteroidales bacterium]
MKKIMLLLSCVALLAACTPKVPKTEYDALAAQKDSIEQENALMNEVISTVNGAMSEIAADQGLLFVDDEGNDLKDKNAVLSRMQTFRNHMADQKAQIEKLKKQNGGAWASNSRLKKLIEDLETQIAAKDSMIADLQNKLETSNASIAELKNQVNIITIAKQQAETDRDHFMEVAQNQDIELNTAYYIVDTKANLKAAGLIEGIFKKKAKYDQMDASKFTKVDIREFKELVIESKKPKLITQKPESSYTLVKNDDGTTTLTITNAVSFWNASPYLIIQK